MNLTETLNRSPGMWLPNALSRTQPGSANDSGRSCLPTSRPSVDPTYRGLNSFVLGFRVGPLPMKSSSIRVTMIIRAQYTT